MNPKEFHRVQFFVQKSIGDHYMKRKSSRSCSAGEKLLGWNGLPTPAPAISNRLVAAQSASQTEIRYFLPRKNLTYDRSRVRMSARPRAGPSLAYIASSTAQQFTCVCLICLVLTAQRPHVPLRVVVCWQICMPTLKRKWTLFVWRYPKKYFIYFILSSVWEPIAPMCYTRRDEQN